MDSNKAVVYNSWRPLIILSQLYGMIFFTRKIPLLLVFIYRVVIFVILVLILIDQLPIIIYWTRDQKSTVDAALQVMKISVAWTNYFFDFLVTCYRNGSIQTIMDDILGMDLTLSTGASRGIITRQITRFVFNFAILILFQVLSVPLPPQEIRKEHSSTCYIFIDSLMAVVVIQFVEFVSLLKEYFTSFDARLSHIRGVILYRSRKVEDIERQRREINRVRVLHFRLVNICQAVNEAYEVQLLLVLIRCFIEATAVFGALVTEDNSERTLPWYIFRISQMGYNLALIAQLCIACSGIVNEVITSKKIAGKITCLAANADNRLIQDELRVFAVQLLHTRLRFRVFSFFDINLELFAQALASISSYITVIYTFKLSQD